MTAPCPDPETLARFADGLASDDEKTSLQTHIDGCASCREVLVALARSSRPAGWTGGGAGPDVPPRGTAIGRYVVLEPRGSGGMGVVLAAYDDKLDRKVALKLLRPDLDRASPERMLREAQLMARVRHPNVVTVFDVGEAGAQIFIAMELVEGRTLRDWREATPHAPWREVVRLFLAAGRGLEAAHAAGVVHRDFKPDNVLLAANGQVLVSDFGLAWSALDAPGGNTAVTGTPAYMAPEQRAGKPIDARADQYAFCVAFWEALFGERPGKPPVAKPGVPAAIAEALARGLSETPEGRWPDLTSLLAAIERSQQRRVPWWAFAAAASLVLAVVAVARPRADECTPSLAGVWDAARRAEVERAFAPNPAASQVVLARFDAFAASWLDIWKVSCTAGKDFARRQVCLDARRSEFAALSDLFAHADAVVVENAVFAVERLRDVRACADGELLPVVPPPEGKQREIAAARLFVARANALNKAGKHAEALAAADEAVQRAQALKYRPLEAEAHLARGDELRASGKFKDAEGALKDAVIAAEAGRDFESLARICVQQILVVGSASMRPDDAEAWLTRAEGALEQMPRPDLRAEVDLAKAVLRLAQFRPADAEAASRASRGWYAENHVPARAADASVILAESLGFLGRFEESLKEIEGAVSARTALLGADHPLTIRARIQVAQAQLKMAQPDAAVATVDALVPVLPKVPPFHRAVAWYTRSLALSGTGKDGVDSADQTIAEISAAVGPKHPYTATGHEARAIALREVGKLKEAVDAHRLSLQLFGAVKNNEAAQAHASYAVTLLRVGDAAEALVQAQAALDGMDGLKTSQWVDRCPALWAWSEAKRVLKQPDAAAAARALACVKARPALPIELERAAQ